MEVLQISMIRQLQLLLFTVWCSTSVLEDILTAHNKVINANSDNKIIKYCTVVNTKCAHFPPNPVADWLTEQIDSIPGHYRVGGWSQ